MGNNPILYVDPDGQWIAQAIGAVIGGISGYISGRRAGLRGGELATFTIMSAGVGALSGGVGSTVGATITSATSSAFIGAVAGGVAGGFVGGFYGTALSGGDPLRGGAVGAASGLVGGSFGAIGGDAGALLGGAAAGATGAALWGGNEQDIAISALVGGTSSYVGYKASSTVTKNPKVNPRLGNTNDPVFGDDVIMLPEVTVRASVDASGFVIYGTGRFDPMPEWWGNRAYTNQMAINIANKDATILYAMLATPLAIIGAGELLGAAAYHEIGAAIWRYPNAGGGGLNILKEGKSIFRLDWHKFKSGGKMISRPHIDIPKWKIHHWPW